MEKLSKTKIPSANLKEALKHHLKHKYFRRAFEKMVRCTLHDGTEYGFDVKLLTGPEVRSKRFANSGIYGGESPTWLGPIMMHGTEDEMGDIIHILASVCVMRVHTHPFENREWGAGIPSPDDVSRLMIERKVNSIGLIVPVNMASGELSGLMFQCTSKDSLRIYKGVINEKEGEEEGNILSAVVERSVLRIMQLAERSKIGIKPSEIDKLINIMDLSYLKEYES